MMMRTRSFLSLAVTAALAASAQEPAPLSAPPRQASPVDTDPPLVQVPGTSLRLRGNLPPMRYPRLARLCRVQGVVTVRLILGVDGTPYPIGEAEGPPLLREAGRDFVRSIRFEPVKVDGQTVRAVSFATVPFRFQDADPGAATTGYLLKLEAGPTIPRQVLGELEAQLRAWLTGIGLTDRAGSVADPAATLLVRVSLAKPMPGQPDVPLTLRFLRLEDQDKAESSLVAGKRILGFGRLLSIGTADIPNEVLASQVRGFLEHIVQPWEKPAKMREAEARLVAEMATGRPLKAQDFNFAQIGVKNQPPPPPYPTLAKLARIQGTVVVELTIDEQGLPIMAHAIDGPPQLRATAEGYALAWLFEPATVSGVPVRARFKLTMPFTLR